MLQLKTVFLKYLTGFACDDGILAFAGIVGRWEPTVDRDKDKNPVVALREIAGETVSLNELENAVVKASSV